MQALGCLMLLFAPFVLLWALFRVGYVAGRLCGRLPVLTVPASLALLWVFATWTARWHAEQEALRDPWGSTSAEGAFADSLRIFWWPVVAAGLGLVFGLIAAYGSIALAGVLSAFAVGVFYGPVAATATLYMGLQEGRCRLWDALLILLVLLPAPWLLAVCLLAARGAALVDRRLLRDLCND